MQTAQAFILQALRVATLAFVYGVAKETGQAATRWLIVKCGQ